MTTVKTESKPWEPIRSPLVDLSQLGAYIYGSQPKTGYTGDFTVTQPNADIQQAMDMMRGLATGQGRPQPQPGMRGQGGPQPQPGMLGRTGGGAVPNAGMPGWSPQGGGGAGGGAVPNPGMRPPNAATANPGMRGYTPYGQASPGMAPMAGGSGTGGGYQNVGMPFLQAGLDQIDLGRSLIPGAQQLGGEGSRWASDRSLMPGAQSVMGGGQRWLGNDQLQAGVGQLDRAGQQWLGDSSLRPAADQALSTGRSITNRGVNMLDNGFKLPTSGLTTQSGHAAGTGIDTLQNFAAGRGTHGGPELDAAIRAAIDPAVQAHNRQVVPALKSAAISKGAYGGNREGVAQGVAAGELNRNAQNLGASMSYQDLAAGRQLQAGAASQLPGIYQGMSQNDINRGLATEQGQTSVLNRGLSTLGAGTGLTQLGSGLLGAQQGLQLGGANLMGTAGNRLAQQQGINAGGANMMNLGAGMVGQQQAINAGGGNMMNLGASLLGQNANLAGAGMGLAQGSWGLNTLAPNALMGVGNTMQGYDQAGIQNAIMRQQEAERAPWSGIQDYMATLQPGLGFSSQTQRGGPSDSTNILQGLMGAGLTGASIYNLMGMAGPAAGAALSDERLKCDLRPVGRTPLGHVVYRFKYLWAPEEYIGVLAQEVMETQPEAVVMHSSGFLMVDYARVA